MFTLVDAERTTTRELANLQFTSLCQPTHCIVFREVFTDSHVKDAIRGSFNHETIEFRLDYDDPQQERQKLVQG